MSDFHDVRFPLDISAQAKGGPQRLTDIVMTGSGREQRNARWAHARRRFEAGYGVKSLAALALVVDFFEERRGRLYGFRWRDRADFKSCSPLQEISAQDQILGLGDGVNRIFQLMKTYGAAFAPYQRVISKPVAESLRLSVDGVEVDPAHFICEANTGRIVFQPDQTPARGAVVSAGFLFDVPVRFDTDFLEVDHTAFAAGGIPKIPLVEIMAEA